MTETRAASLAPGLLAPAVEALSEGVAALDADGVFGYLNPAATALLGLGSEELLGRTVTEVLPEAAELIDCLSRAREAAGTPVTWHGRVHPGGAQLFGPGPK